MQFATQTVELDQLAKGIPAESWLSSAEWTHYADLPQNRSTLAWLGGRWCAKQLLRQMPDSSIISTCDIHVESRNGLRQGIAPRIFYKGRLQPWKLSISHGNHICAAAMSLDQAVLLGLDIVDLEADCGNIEEMWLSRQESAWCDKGISLAIVWALKEAIYKAIGNGAHFQPRKLDISRWFCLEHLHRISESDASPSAGISIDGRGSIWWKRFGRELLVVVQLKSKTNSMNSTATKHLRREAILQ